MNLQQAIPRILPVACHTDNIGQGSTFVAIKGTKFDGTTFIKSALEKGANKIVIQNDTILSEDILNLINISNAQLINVKDCRQSLAQLSAQSWNYPSKKLNIIGVTGTKGKTTTTYILHHLLSAAGYKTAMISGVENIINGKKYLSQLTTPLPDYLHAFFFKCTQENVQFVIMETSAQAFSLKRLEGIDFAGAIFTNLDLEHMEFYSSMEEYYQAKCEIFKQLKSNSPVILNIDNQWCEKISNLNKDYIKLSLAKNKKSDFFINIKKNNLSGLEITITCKKGKFNFNIPSLIGTFNVYNIASCIALCFELGIYPKTIMDGLLSFGQVPGRMEQYNLSNEALAIIDYAHNPSSFLHILPTLKSISKNLIVVFGAGGDRDKQKRPIMGNIAANFADKVILTMDNPRSENVQDIINQIYNGIPVKNHHKIICETDRKKAIEYAYSIAQKNDVIAILGKGPDEYQIIGEQKTFFSDKQTILNCQK